MVPRWCVHNDFTAQGALQSTDTGRTLAAPAGLPARITAVAVAAVTPSLVAATDIYEDNLACIAMSTNPVRRKSSRHIDIRVHFCRELYTAGIMRLNPLRTHLMVADALTKSLPDPALTQHREVMLGMLLFTLDLFTSSSLLLSSCETPSKYGGE